MRKVAEDFLFYGFIAFAGCELIWFISKLITEG